MQDYFLQIISLVAEKKWTDKFLKGQGFCIICNHNDPLDLEYHHIAGKSNYPLVTVSLCRNCHGKVSRKQYLWPEGWSNKDNDVKRKNALMLRGISDLIRVKSDYIFFGDDYE